MKMPMSRIARFINLSVTSETEIYPKKKGLIIARRGFSTIKILKNLEILQNPHEYYILWSDLEDT